MSWMEILLPVFVQVILTLVVAWSLAFRRIGGIRSGTVRAKDIALREPNWPNETRQYENSYLNQFELPVLFYVLMILLMITRQADIILMMLAWIFVVTRVVHAYVHVTSNNLNLRGPMFGVGLLILTIMWLYFIVNIITVR